MTQLGESVAIIPPPPKEPEPQEQERKPIKLRISLFFDGTMNNRMNIEAREKKTAAYQKHGDDGSSYENGRTNIAIMEPHLKETAKDYDFYHKEYIEGIGTFTEGNDSTIWGGGFGAGDSGVVTRAEEGIGKVLQWILDHEDVDKYENEITKLSIDVFGFSRGAAAARYAIFLLLKDKNKELKGRLEGYGYVVADDAVEAKFAGLYDTVLSYKLSQLFKGSSNRLEQKAIKYAKKAIHLAAADEHRKNFPLHNIKGAKANGGEEYYLPGVHSDVGGSYNLANETEIQKLIAEELKQKKSLNITYMLEAKEKMKINDGWYFDVLEDKKNLVKQGWYKEVDLKGNENPLNEIWIEKEYDWEDDFEEEENPYASLYVDRKNIHTAYSNIPLKIMADFARKSGGDLTIDAKLEDRADIVIKGSDLNKLEGLVKDSVSSKSASNPDYWLKSDVITEYRNKHLNFSSKAGLTNGPRMKKNKRVRYIYDA